MNKKITTSLLFILVVIWAPLSSWWAYYAWEITIPSLNVWWITIAFGQAFFYIGGALFIHALYRKYSDPHLTFFRSTTVFALMIFWSLFAALWGFWQLGGITYEIFSSAWWFDEIGHAIFGAVLAISLLLFHQNYSPTYPPLLRALGERHLMRDILGEVALGAMLWEAAELLKDLYSQQNYSSWIAKAQLNSVDTTLDIISAMLFAVLALFAYEAAKKLYHRLLHGDESREEAADALEIFEYFAKKIHFHSRRELKKFISSLKPPD